MSHLVEDYPGPGRPFDEDGLCRRVVLALDFAFEAVDHHQAHRAGAQMSHQNVGQLPRFLIGEVGIGKSAHCPVQTGESHSLLDDAVVESTYLESVIRYRRIPVDEVVQGKESHRHDRENRNGDYEPPTPRRRRQRFKEILFDIPVFEDRFVLDH